MTQALQEAKFAAVQEHKLPPRRMDEVSSQLARSGIKWMGSPAIITEKQGISSGVALVAHPSADVWFEGATCCLFPGRLCYAFARTPEIGLVCIYVLYLVTGLGMQGTNVLILEAMISHIVTHNLPWLAPGDYNLDPGIFAAVEWVHKLRVKVSIPPVPTCHASAGSHTVRDYFLLSADISECFETPQIAPHILMPTHDAVDSWVKPREQWPVVKVIAPQPTLPTTRPAGPVRPRGQWQLVTDTIAAARAAAHSDTVRQPTWQHHVDEARHQLGTAMASDMEELCGALPGELAPWNSAIIIEDKPLDQIVCKGPARTPRPSILAQRASGVAFNITGTLKRIWLLLSAWTATLTGVF